MLRWVGAIWILFGVADLLLLLADPPTRGFGVHIEGTMLSYIFPGLVVVGLGSALGQIRDQLTSDRPSQPAAPLKVPRPAGNDSARLPPRESAPAGTSPVTPVTPEQASTNLRASRLRRQFDAGEITKEEFEAKIDELTPR